MRIESDYVKKYFDYLYLVVAFLVALDQNKQLLGKNGLLPTDNYLKLIKNHFRSQSIGNAFMNIPTLLLFVNEAEIDFWLDVISYIGLFISAVIFFLGASNVIMMFTLWILYHSIVNVGQRW